MGSPHERIDPTTHRTMSERSYHGATSRSRVLKVSEQLVLCLFCFVLFVCLLCFAVCGRGVGGVGGG